MEYSKTRRFNEPMDTMEARVRAALGENGFGVLTEIDVAATLQQKIGVDRGPYKILGACNPSIAHRALEREPAIGLMLPCNVVLYTEDGDTIVSFVDPHAMLSLGDSPALDELADEAAGLLDAALESL